MKLDQKLNWYAEKGADEQQAQLAGSEPKTAAMNEGNRHHAEAGKEKTVEHHVFDAHLVERQPAEVESRAPEAAGY